MLLQTNSYIVPKDKRTEHTRLVKRFKQVMARMGCDDFEVFEQTNAEFSHEAGGRFVQIIRFKDLDQAKRVRGAEKTDPDAQQLIQEFCELVNYAYQAEKGLATTSFYSSVVVGGKSRVVGTGLPEVDGRSADSSKQSTGRQPADSSNDDVSIIDDDDQMSSSDDADIIDADTDVAGRS